MVLTRTVSLWFLFVAAGPLATGQVVSAQAPFVAAEEGWTDLFNGRDLSGWTVKCKDADAVKNLWRVDKGTLLADSLGWEGHDYVWLVSDHEFQDFVLKLEFQAFRDSPGNSGVQIRSRYDDTARWLDGPQVDIHPPAPWRTGMVWDETRGSQRWLSPNLPKERWVDESMAVPPRVFYYADDSAGWNSLEISVVGMVLKAVLNGVEILNYDGNGVLNDAIHREKRVGEKGHIALQIHRGDELKIRFRNIKVKGVTPG